MTIRAGALVDVADYADGGWVALTLAGTFTGTLAARRIGDRINVRGLVVPATNWGAANADNNICATVPSNLQSPIPHVEISATSSAVATTVFRVVSNGAFISARCSTATHTGSVYINYDYLAD